MQLITKSSIINIDQILALYLLGLLEISPKVIAIIILFL